jgi:hypothetical protein
MKSQNGIFWMVQWWVLVHSSPVELTFLQIFKKSLLEPTVVQITSQVLPNGGTTGQITSTHSSIMMPFFISY